MYVYELKNMTKLLTGVPGSLGRGGFIEAWILANLVRPEGSWLQLYDSVPESLLRTSQAPLLNPIESLVDPGRTSPDFNFDNPGSKP